LVNLRRYRLAILDESDNPSGGTMDGYRFIRFFSEIGIGDVPLVGGKNASLGEMYRELKPKGINVPNGFAITAEAYRHLLASADILPKLKEALAGLDVANVTDLAKRAERCRELIYGTPLPPSLVQEILDAYRRLQTEYGDTLTLAVRSSATAEDLPTASFAGQHESFLNISGERQLLDSVQRCFASLFKDRAIRYRIDNGFDHFKVFLSVGVMKMVRSDLAASGVMFSLDTESGFRDVVFITGAYGLGENVVQGVVDPDEFYVFKPTLKQGFRNVLRRALGAKKVKMVYATGGMRLTTRNLPTSEAERERYCLTDAEVLTLADQALIIDDHYAARAGKWTPMDTEWAKDGLDGKLYIVQSRPETVASRRAVNELETFKLTGKGELRVTGRSVGGRIASGRARVVRGVADLASFKPGEVLVADSTAPDWGTVMKTAAAIVTNRGGRTCHAAIVARELGIPAVVGAERATDAIKDGEEVTVSCAEGAVGKVYAGRLPYKTEKIDLGSLPKPRTHLMMNVGAPEAAFALSFIPNDGVGLARMEFIVSEYIKVHPMALVHPERVADETQRAEILRMTRGYGKPSDYFVERLAEGVATIAAAFYPKPVIVRMSDFKTNEYASLLGGRASEPVEENPMLGFRGASRYTHPAYADGFALECAAMKRVRDEMGLVNLKLMIPFCRRVQEAEQVVARMAELGLKRGVRGLEIYVMCEIPNNVIQVDAFSRHFDGFSIGSNDLTQLVLGVDRDSAMVAFDFDERDAGAMEFVRQAIVGAHRNGRHIGICGQAPSDYPEYVDFLVEQRIDSISLNPDAVLPMLKRLSDAEQSARNAAAETVQSEALSFD
jgi:pyruvate, water dikinase